jgi:two-component system, chemotaxis family, protein-glutamate methylesterase/glutaminase
VVDRIRVLVVDDSAFARKVMREVLSAAPDIDVVGTAYDGLDALEKIEQLSPDVVTLDLVMPNLDGVGVLKAVPSQGAPRFIVVSMADEHGELALSALDAGAIDFVHKPTALAVQRLYDVSDELVAKVRVAAAARSPGPRVSFVPSEARLPAAKVTHATELLLIGASTGGPQALTKIVTALPADFPVPVGVVLHMPPGYTEAFARRIDGESAVEVVEASEGLPFVAGRVIVGRAGMHLYVARAADGGLCCHLDVRPMDKPHRPSVDVMFASAAEVVGQGVLGVVLTGMGDDGMRGAAALKARGASVITEAESSCVVYGMPRSVFEAGYSDAQAELSAMLAAISARL